MARYTKADLVNDLLLQDVFADASRRKVTEFVDDLLQSISDKVADGDEVAFAKFGRFYKFAGTKEGKPTGKFFPKFAAYGDFKTAVN